jgi:RNA polymerase sigma factor (sigma-70 family)
MPMRRSKKAVGQVWRAVEPGEDGASRDARLVDGLRCGAPDAFAGLHEEYAAGIYTLALRMVRHAPDAEDITQDVLIRAYERVPRDREVLLRPWLYRLTLNCCYDHLRAAARRRSSSGDAHGAEVELVSPVDLFEQSELQRLFEAALGDLTRRQRAALLLKDVHGLSLVEVGACLELTTGSVEVLLARARKAFRASFEGRCPAEGRPAPSSAGLLAGLPALPFYPLPPALLAPPALPTVPPLPMSLPPIAGGGLGLGAALGLPASLKTAALILAAAATVGTAEVAVTRSEAPPVKRPVAVVPVAGATSVAQHARAAAPSPRPSAAGRTAQSPTPSPTASAVVADEPSPPTTVGDDPTASPPPLGISSPTPTPDATPSPSPTAHATASPTPTPVPSPTATAPAPSPSPAP